MGGPFEVRAMFLRLVRIRPSSGLRTRNMAPSRPARPSQGESNLRSSMRFVSAALFAGLMSAVVGGCGSTDIPLAEAPRVAQPDPVPIEKLPKNQRPPKFSSARAVLRFDPAKSHGGPPR